MGYLATLVCQSALLELRGKLQDARKWKRVLVRPRDSELQRDLEDSPRKSEQSPMEGQGTRRNF